MRIPGFKATALRTGLRLDLRSKNPQEGTHCFSVQIIPEKVFHLSLWLTSRFSITHPDNFPIQPGIVDCVMEGAWWQEINFCVCSAMVRIITRHVCGGHTLVDRSVCLPWHCCSDSGDNSGILYRGGRSVPSARTVHISSYCSWYGPTSLLLSLNHRGSGHLV